MDKGGGCSVVEYYSHMLQSVNSFWRLPLFCRMILIIVQVHTWSRLLWSDQKPEQWQELKDHMIPHLDWTEGLQNNIMLDKGHWWGDTGNDAQKRSFKWTLTKRKKHHIQFLPFSCNIPPLLCLQLIETWLLSGALWRSSRVFDPSWSSRWRLLVKNAAC